MTDPIDNGPEEDEGPFSYVDISDEDAYAAMAEISGFLDITPGDFKILYRHAFRHAVERLSCTVRADEAMDPDAPSVPADMPLLQVAERMTETGALILPVIDADRRVLGIITRSDFLLCIAPDHAHEALRMVGNHNRERRGLTEEVHAPMARDIMHSPAVTVGTADSAREVMTTVRHTGHARFPVIDRSGRLAGMLFLNDLMKRCHL
jgi:CBS-domain-containing membrane protein